MSKKKDKKKLILGIDDNEDLFKIFMVQSKDGMIIGNTNDKGKYFTSLPNKESGDFSIHRTETQPDGTKKYPERKEFGDFIRVFKESIDNLKTSDEIINKLSENSYIIPLSYEDIDIKDYIKQNKNEARINFIEYFKDRQRKYQANEKLDKDKFESIVKRHSKGFVIVDVGNEILFFIKPMENGFFVLDTSELLDYINFLLKIVPKISDDKLESIKKKIVDLEKY